eukprot:1127271-Rhodomonas_salina.1
MMMMIKGPVSLFVSCDGCKLTDRTAQLPHLCEHSRHSLTLRTLAFTLAHHARNSQSHRRSHTLTLTRRSHASE